MKTYILVALSFCALMKLEFAVACPNPPCGPDSFSGSGNGAGKITDRVLTDIEKNQERIKAIEKHGLVSTDTTLLPLKSGEVIVVKTVGKDSIVITRGLPSDGSHQNQITMKDASCLGLRKTEVDANQLLAQAYMEYLRPSGPATRAGVAEIKAACSIAPAFAAGFADIYRTTPASLGGPRATD